MAFEDDMIDAGFNDPMEYLESLMDEGDRIVQRQLERERDYCYTHDSESPYDGMSETQIARLEEQIDREIATSTKRSIANLKIYAKNNPEYQAWKLEHDNKSLMAFWRVIITFGWTWNLNKELKDLDAYDFRFSDMLYNWRRNHSEKAPGLMDYLYNCWLDDLQLQNTTNDAENCLSNVYDIMQFKLKDYRSGQEESLRKKLKEKYGHEFIYQIIDDGVSIEDLEAIIGKVLLTICYKNTGLSGLHKLKDKKPWNELIDWNSLNQIIEYDFNQEGWFSISKTEKSFFNTIFLFYDIVKQRRLSIDLTWIDFYYFRMLSWIIRMNENQDELKRLINKQLFLLKDDKKEANRWKKTIKQLINNYMSSVINKYQSENYMLSVDSSKGITLSDVYNLVAWNTDHPNNRF